MRQDFMPIWYGRVEMSIHENRNGNEWEKYTREMLDILDERVFTST